MSKKRIPGEERVFSLVLALVASPGGATKRELLSTVYGYSQRFHETGATDTLERQFERDKEQVRALGIAIETIDSPLEPGNTQLTRYRISRDRLQMPAELRFTERELMLLRTAALAWSEGSLTEQARRAAMKLEALGAGLDVQHLGVAPRIWAPDASLSALQRAIEEQAPVRFEYRMPDRGEPLERHVAPLRLHRADGRWHLIAWDLEREDDRVFLLQRVTSAVTVLNEEFDAALRDRADQTVARLLARETAQPSTVYVRRGSMAESRLMPRALERPDIHEGSEWTRIRIGTLDYHEHALAEELVGYGSDVAVHAPEELVTAVRERLELIVSAHSATQEQHA